jgi:hypothetical protein
MRRRPSRLVAVVAAVFALTGCDARVYGSPPSPSEPPVVVIAPQGRMAPLPEAAPDEAATSFGGLDARITEATAEAAAKGADITTVVLDRSTRQRLTNGNNKGIPIASVVKLFIADDLLFRGPPLSPDELKSFQSMLRSSDDSAAEVFWERGGGGAIVTRLAARYGLSGTRPPDNGMWFNTVSTAADLVRYYDMMLSGAGGLPMDKADLIVDNLAQSTPTGIDGMRLDVRHRDRLDAPVHRRHRRRPPFRHGDRVGPVDERRCGASDHHAGGHDDVPRRQDLAVVGRSNDSRRVRLT